MEFFEKKLHQVISIIGKLGKKTERLIKKTFDDIDSKKVGFLTKVDLNMLFGMICDMLHVQRLEEWELEYLLNLLDDDGNRTIDLQEFIDNY